MKKNTSPLQCNTFYHIYNRGINKENIFKEEKNYDFFLEKYIKYIQPVAATYAYTLLKNHFHFLILTRSEEEVRNSYSLKKAYSTGDLISKKFSHLFNSYAQAINKSFKRTGGLFETPFRRIAVNNDHYLTQLIYYIHFNAQKHDFVNDFTIYNHSSYPIYLNNKTTFLARSSGIEWFGNKEFFINQHREWAREKLLSSNVIFTDFENDIR